MGFPSGSDSKESAYNAGDPGLIPGPGSMTWATSDCTKRIFTTQITTME